MSRIRDLKQDGLSVRAVAAVLGITRADVVAGSDPAAEPPTSAAAAVYFEIHRFEAGSAVNTVGVKAGSMASLPSGGPDANTFGLVAKVGYAGAGLCHLKRPGIYLVSAGPTWSFGDPGYVLAGVRIFRPDGTAYFLGNASTDDASPVESGHLSLSAQLIVPDETGLLIGFRFQSPVDVELATSEVLISRIRPLRSE